MGTVFGCETCGLSVVLSVGPSCKMVSFSSNKDQHVPRRSLYHCILITVEDAKNPKIIFGLNSIAHRLADVLQEKTRVFLDSLFVTHILEVEGSKVKVSDAKMLKFFGPNSITNSAVYFKKRRMFLVGPFIILLRFGQGQSQWSRSMMGKFLSRFFGHNSTRNSLICFTYKPKCSSTVPLSLLFKG